jgi:hypothetical protein
MLITPAAEQHSSITVSPFVMSRQQRHEHNEIGAFPGIVESENGGIDIPT